MGVSQRTRRSLLCPLERRRGRCCDCGTKDDEDCSSGDPCRLLREQQFCNSWWYVYVETSDKVKLETLANALSNAEVSEWREADMTRAIFANEKEQMWQYLFLVHRKLDPSKKRRCVNWGKDKNGIRTMMLELKLNLLEVYGVRCCGHIPSMPYEVVELWQRTERKEYGPLVELGDPPLEVIAGFDEARSRLIQEARRAGGKLSRWRI